MWLIFLIVAGLSLVAGAIGRWFIPLFDNANTPIYGTFIVMAVIGLWFDFVVVDW